MSAPRPVPSKTAIHALRSVVFGTTCSLVIVAEERRRRIDVARTIVENGRLLRSQPRYSTAGAASIVSRFDQSLQGPPEYTENETDRLPQDISSGDMLHLDSFSKMFLGNSQDSIPLPASIKVPPLKPLKAPMRTRTSTPKTPPRTLPKNIAVAELSRPPEQHPSTQFSELGDDQSSAAVPDAAVMDKDEDIQAVLDRMAGTLEAQSLLKSQSQIFDSAFEAAAECSELPRTLLTIAAVVSQSCVEHRQFEEVEKIFDRIHGHKATKPSDWLELDIPSVISSLLRNPGHSADESQWRWRFHFTARLLTLQRRALSSTEGRSREELYRFLAGELESLPDLDFGTFWQTISGRLGWRQTRQLINRLLDARAELQNTPRVTNEMQWLPESARKTFKISDVPAWERPKVLSTGDGQVDAVIQAMSLANNNMEWNASISKFKEALEAGLALPECCTNMAVDAALALEGGEYELALQLLRQARSARRKIFLPIQRLMMGRLNALDKAVGLEERCEMIPTGEACSIYDNILELFGKVEGWYTIPQAVYNKASRVCLRHRLYWQSNAVCLAAAEVHGKGRLGFSAFNLSNLIFSATATRDVELLGALMDSLRVETQTTQDTVCKQALKRAHRRLRAALASSKTEASSACLEDMLVSLQTGQGEYKAQRARTFGPPRSKSVFLDRASKPETEHVMARPQWPPAHVAAISTSA